MLRSSLCDYGETCNVVKRTIDLWTAAANENDKAQKDVAFKNSPPFTSNKLFQQIDCLFFCLKMVIITLLEILHTISRNQILQCINWN